MLTCRSSEGALAYGTVESYLFPVLVSHTPPVVEYGRTNSDTVP